jgi:two-component system, sporulation sensor kinase E
MSTPTIAPFDVGKFFRQYVGRKITTLPHNIRIVPPITVASCEIWTSPEFLHSIIENLVKNSIEAMPDGGEIRLDWVFDQTDKSLLIEVADTGPGIDAILLEHLLAGEPVESTKERGSGIGMVTVRTMLRGIGGTISAESVPDKGTRWIITLPSLEETDEPIGVAETDDTETLLASEKEVDLR